MKKKLTLFFITLFSAVTFASELPRIAVYVTGDVPENVKNALGTRMLSAFINLGRYRGIERSNAFLAEIEKEQIKQRSGAIDDSQISALGRQFGVQFICVANVIQLFDAFQVSARIVDVETAEIIHIGESYSPLQTVEDFRKASHEVVRVMLGSQRGAAPRARSKAEPEPAAIHLPQPVQTAPQERTLDEGLADGRRRAEPKPDISEPKPPVNYKFWTAAGLDVLGIGLIAYGLVENQNVIDQDKKGKYSSAERSLKKRNIAYGAGAAALLSGLSLHFFF
ncbi:MAG: hypothetical protein FWE57_03970 [Chitinispirillia bacterium]|nr:hypothetical protein [Chitinispirillia bacterium]